MQPTVQQELLHPQHLGIGLVTHEVLQSVSLHVSTQHEQVLQKCHTMKYENRR